ncbi:hypothetical protein V2J09_014845 [Rumex salicifolius]
MKSASTCIENDFNSNNFGTILALAPTKLVSLSHHQKSLRINTNTNSNSLILISTFHLSTTFKFINPKKKMALTIRSSASFTNLRDHKILRVPEESRNTTVSFAPIKSSNRIRAFAPIRAEKLMQEHVSMSDSYGGNQNYEKLHEMAIPQQQTTGSKVPVFVMLPLDTVSFGGSLNKAKAMNASLMALKTAGVEGVMVDAWWGLIEKDGPKKYNWDGYSDLIKMVQKHGMKLQVVMSFHQCGGNVGDSCSIPLPPWVLEEISKNPDLVYTDRSGRRNPEYITLGCDSLPVLAGRTPIQVYSDFMRSFQEKFRDYMGKVVVEIQVGMGPCGELRYPSYPESNGTWKFPGIGEFQCYDKYMRASLQAAAVSIGKADWGGSGPHDSGQYNQFPEDTGFFQREGTWDTEYGQFFLGWYSGMLIEHGDKILEAAKGVFRGTGVKLSGKIAGIHWHYKTRSHAAELTAGYYNTRNHNGYLAAAKMFSKYEAIFNFTCMEMKDYEQPSYAGCSPEGLVKQVKMATKTAGIELAGENALERYDSSAYEQVLLTSRCDSGNGLAAFTYLRMNRKLFEGENWRHMVDFVRNMSDGGRSQRHSIDDNSSSDLYVRFIVKKIIKEDKEAVLVTSELSVRRRRNRVISTAEIFNQITKLLARRLSSKHESVPERYSRENASGGNSVKESEFLLHFGEDGSTNDVGYAAKTTGQMQSTVR